MYICSVALDEMVLSSLVWFGGATDLEGLDLVVCLLFLLSMVYKPQK